MNTNILLPLKGNEDKFQKALEELNKLCEETTVEEQLEIESKWYEALEPDFYKWEVYWKI